MHPTRKREPTDNETRVIALCASSGLFYKNSLSLSLKDNHIFLTSILFVLQKRLNFEFEVFDEEQDVMDDLRPPAIMMMMVTVAVVS